MKIQAKTKQNVMKIKTWRIASLRFTWCYQRLKRVFSFKLKEDFNSPHLTLAPARFSYLFKSFIHNF